MYQAEVGVEDGLDTDGVERGVRGGSAARGGGGVLVDGQQLVEYREAVA